MKPSQVVKVSMHDGCYILDAMALKEQPWVCLSTSELTLKLYDTTRLSFVANILGHTQPITDLADAGGGVLYTSQRDTGVMVTDLRQQRPVRFLDELQSSGKDCSTLAVSPSGTKLAVAIGDAVQLVDTRTFSSVAVMQDVHTDDISRLRFFNESCFVSGSEDQMVNFVHTEGKDSNSLLCTAAVGEVLSRLVVVPPGPWPTACACAIGTCETMFAFPLPADPINDDFPVEAKIPRSSMGIYGVDFVSLGGEMYALLGQHEQEHDVVLNEQGLRADDAPPMEMPEEAEQTLSSRMASAASAQKLPLLLRPMSQSQGQALTDIPLDAMHTGVVRAAVSLPGDKMITVGEDSQMVCWTPTTTPEVGVDEDDSGSQTSSGKEKTRKRQVRRPF